MTLATLARRLLAPEVRSLLNTSAVLIESQANLILRQHAQMQAMEVEHYRELRGMIGGWLLSMETPEIDVRDDLATLDRELADRISLIEEHLV